MSFDDTDEEDLMREMDLLRADIDKMKAETSEVLAIFEQKVRAQRDLDAARLKTLLALYEGCKWADSGPLVDLRPEDEKYMTSASLIAALDKLIAERP